MCFLSRHSVSGCLQILVRSYIASGSDGCCIYFGVTAFEHSVRSPAYVGVVGRRKFNSIRRRHIPTPKIHEALGRHFISHEHTHTHSKHFDAMPCHHDGHQTVVVVARWPPLDFGEKSENHIRQQREVLFGRGELGEKLCMAQIQSVYTNIHVQVTRNLHMIIFLVGF